MEGVFLCSEYLKSHPLYNTYGSDLATLAERDYPGQGIFRGCDIPAIDLDAFEISTETSNDCTSDGAIGIADCHANQLKNQRLLLTELRLGYENQRNLHFSNLQRKYRHSRDIMHNYDPDARIDPEFALIFTESLAPRARRWIRDWGLEAGKKDAKNWKAYNPESFCNHINYGKSLPLTPTEGTISFLESLCSNANIGVDELYIFKERVESYLWKIRGKNLSEDLKYFSEKILSFLSSVHFPNGEEGEYCQYLKEEIEGILTILNQSIK